MISIDLKISSIDWVEWRPAADYPLNSRFTRCSKVFIWLSMIFFDCHWRSWIYHDVYIFIEVKEFYSLPYFPMILIDFKWLSLSLSDVHWLSLGLKIVHRVLIHPVGFEWFPLTSNDFLSKNMKPLKTCENRWLLTPLNNYWKSLKYIKNFEHHWKTKHWKLIKIIWIHWTSLFFDGFTLLGL